MPDKTKSDSCCFPYQEKLDELKKHAKSIGKDIDTYVKEHPYRAAAIAAGIGAVLAVLINSKHDD